MIKKFTLLIILISSISNGQTSIIATYKKSIGNYKTTMVNDSLKKQIQKKGLLSSMESSRSAYHTGAKNILKKLEFQFLTNQTSCVFSVKESGLLKDDENYDSALIIGMNNLGVYYSNTEEKASLHQKSVFGETFLVQNPFIKVDWKLENESKQIGRFTCFKATATIVETNHANISKTYPVTCWYTTEIPTNNLGPAGFNGLPGLIVSLQKGNTFLNLVTVEVKENHLKIEKPKEGIVATSQKEFEQKGMELYKRMMSNRRKN